MLLLLLMMMMLAQLLRMYSYPSATVTSSSDVFFLLLVSTSQSLFPSPSSRRVSGVVLIVDVGRIGKPLAHNSQPLFTREGWLLLAVNIT